MAAICQTCGDEGFSVALIYCYDCEEVAVHRYCLEVLPKTFDEYVVWFCDDCKPLDLKLNGMAEPRSPPPEGNDSKDLKSVSSASPEEDDLQNLEAAKLTQPRGRSEKKSRKRKTMIRTGEDQKGLNEGKDSSCSTAETDAQITEGSQLPQPSCNQKNVNGQTGSKPSLNLEGEKSTFEVADYAKNLSAMPALDLSKTAMDIDYVPAQPIIDPIWRGGLQISEHKAGYSCRIVAHLSQLACSRVSEEAKLFPGMLSSELRPRSTVWPKGFEHSGPRDGNIALYFFPDSESDEEVFKNLVSEMIRNDLAMRAVVTHAELLVFTSTKLPLRLWRFQGKLYLWGVFRKRQDSSELPKSSAASAEKELRKGGHPSEGDRRTDKTENARSRISKMATTPEQDPREN